MIPRSSQRILPRGLRMPFAFALVAFALLPQLLNAQSKRAAIEGRVRNAATELYLEGAEVRVAGSALSTLTDREGRFTLTGVNPGAHTVTIRYPGLDPVSVSVEVGESGAPPVDVKLTSGLYKMDEFVVAGEREGQALAVALQRAAPNIKNVLSTDAFGNVADTNLGNMLKRVPGITGESDQGDIYLVRVRGIDPNLNAVTVDNTRLPSATTKGAYRAFEIDKVSTNYIERVEVTKAPTPDMDADSIGGSINLVTKSAYDRAGRELMIQAGTNYHSERKTFRPSAAVVYSDVYNAFGGTNNLGVVLSASYNRTNAPRHSVGVSFEWTTSEPAYMNGFGISEDDIEIDRVGTGVKFDYKVNESTSVFVNLMYNYYYEDMFQHKTIYNAQARVVARTNAQGVPVNDEGQPASVLPGYTHNVTNLVNGEFVYEIESQDRYHKTLLAAVGGRHKGNGWEADFDASYAPSRSDEDRRDLDFRVPGIAFTIDRSRSIHVPAVRITGGPDVSNYDNGYTERLQTRDHFEEDSIAAAQVNYKKNFDLPIETFVKTGLRFRGQRRDTHRGWNYWRYVGPDGVAGRNPATGLNDDNLNRFKNDGHTHLPMFGKHGFPLAAWPNTLAIHEERARNPQLFRYDAEGSYEDTVGGDGQLREDIIGHYLLGSVDFGKFSLLGGVRTEWTRDEGTAHIRDFSKLTLQEQFAQKTTVKADYKNVFPGLHLKYEPANGLVFRGSWTRSIGRPNFGNIIPYTEVNTIDREISQNNTGLKPQFSDNFDLSAEYYFEPVGLLSVSLFRKEITDFIAPVETVVGNGADNGFGGRYAGYAYQTQSNGGFATIEGYELNYQQQLTFLPGALRGLGVYANYTHLKAFGDYGEGRARAEVPGFVPKTVNVGLTFTGFGATVRLQGNHLSSYNTRYNSRIFRKQYRESRQTLDLDVRYRLTKLIDLYLDVQNLTNEYESRYTAEVPSRIIDTQAFGVKSSFGVITRF